MAQDLCQGTTQKGKCCKQPALPRSDFCQYHEPNRGKKFSKKSSKKGGKATRATFKRSREAMRQARREIFGENYDDYMDLCAWEFRHGPITMRARWAENYYKAMTDKLTRGDATRSLVVHIGLQEPDEPRPDEG